MLDRIKLNGCDECSGICCLNPPELRSIEELALAHKLKAKILGLKVDTDKYILTIAKDVNTKACKFLDMETGKCSIYENRFEACRLLECKITNDNGVSVDDFMEGKIGMPKKASEPYYFKKADIKRYGVKVADKDYIIKKAFLTDMEDYARLAIPILTKQ